MIDFNAMFAEIFMYKDVFSNAMAFHSAKAYAIIC
jgi:hypothetical protein